MLGKLHSCLYKMMEFLKLNNDFQMLQLPGELAVMQNQAIECRLSNENSSPELNAKLKQLAEGKCLMVHIEQVDNNR